MIIEEYPDIKAAWEGAYFGMLDDEPGYIDFYQRNIIHSFDNNLTIEKGVFDFDLGEIGLTPTKWTKFTGQYIDVDRLHAWVNNAMKVKTYDSLYQFKDIAPNFTGKKAVHQWGKCLLGFSFRRQPRPSTLTLYTRAQSLGFSGVADYALCDFVARKLAEQMGVEQSSIRIVIKCANFLIKIVEVIHVLERRGLLQEYRDRDNRISRAIEYYYTYLNQETDGADLKWRAANRMRQKLRRFESGEFRSLPVVNLTIKGWDYHRRTGKIRTLRETQQHVLAGKRGPDILEVA